VCSFGVSHLDDKVKMTKGNDMKVNEVKQKAKALGINCGKMKKTELIRSIQKTEGNTPCFGTSNGECQHIDCCFIRDCLKIRT